MGDIKQANFRIDTDTADAFRCFCEEQGFNQAQGFDHLMQVLELNRAKAKIDGRLTEITTFEEYIKKIMDAYLNSLQIAQNTEELVREDFKSDISLRDRAIAEAEQKIVSRDESIRQLEAELTSARQIAAEAVKTSENASKQAASASQIAEEKGKINDMLSAKLADAEEKISGYDELKAAENQFKKQIDSLQHNNDLIQSELNHAKEKIGESSSKIEELNKALESSDSTVVELKSQIANLTRDLEEQKRSFEQAQELAVERAIVKTEKSMLEQIAVLREEKSRLEMKLEMITASKSK